MDQRPLILFDGVCNLCHGAVRWVLARDREGLFDFASLQSAVGRAALDEHVRDQEVPDSIVLIDDRGAHFRSDAAIAIARALGLPWSLAAVGSILPRPIRDGLYRLVAARRYRWFGRREVCDLPAPGQAERFLDAGELAPRE